MAKAKAKATAASGDGESSGLAVTQSELKSFLICPRLEWYSYHAGPEGFGVKVRDTPDYFIEGELGHYALAKWYETGAKGKPLMLRQNMVNRVNEMIADMGEITPEADNRLRAKLAAMIGACHGYKHVRISDFEKYEVVFVEKEFEIEVAGVTLRGKLDLGLKDKTTGEFGFMDNKFVQTIPTDAYSALPLDLQQMVYCLGFIALTGDLPKWYTFNFVKKSQLRRKGMTGDASAPEPLLQYEARVQQQYVEEPEKMFFRPPHIPVEGEVFKRVREQVENIITRWVESSKLPLDKIPMNFTSCEGRYGNLCAFGPACTACLAGRGDNGWDSPVCRGLYEPKESKFPELEGKD